MTVVTLIREQTTGALVAPAAVRVRRLNHVFGSGETAKQVLFDFELDVSRGEIVLLMGPSGCGKTTVLTLVGALRSMQSGSVQTLGTELCDADEPTMIGVRRQIGFIYQAHNLHESLTAIENVRMGLEVHGPAALGDWRNRCEAVLAAVGLTGFEDRYPAKLSGGQKQRVAIARALVARPPLILADEPTAALDKATGRQIVDLLQDLAKKQGSAILMVTHDNRILDIADRIVEMEDGRIQRIVKGAS
ncbi:MAG: ATP-binding cassette domain-containing protein [Gammaproteobacteria bacterium]|nr:ATP-binding cassette domain-containing protein [Gammaproteobacteria bacterium]